jgi:SMC interacting uncharacterized protein involved in chromosome segregation
MRDDLENYKKVAQMSKELATYYSPFTPLTQYKREILIKLPQIKSEIIDLKEAMKETSDNIDGLKTQIKELTAANAALTLQNGQQTRANHDMGN